MPVTPVVSGSPVAFVSVADVGVPSKGVTNVGLVARTTAPEPVEEPKEVALPTDVTTPVKFALVVTVPAVSPEAVPVIFVPTNADGVPKAGVTSVGLVASTLLPVPVLVTLTMFLLASSAKAVEAVNADRFDVPELLKPATVSVVPLNVMLAEPANAPNKLYCTCVVKPPGLPPMPVGVAHEPSPRQNVVDDADVPLFRLVTGKLPVTPVLNGRPVTLVITPDAGVPKAGVTKVGLVANTFAPVPVSSVKAPAS